MRARCAGYETYLSPSYSVMVSGATRAVERWHRFTCHPRELIAFSNGHFSAFLWVTQCWIMRECDHGRQMVSCLWLCFVRCDDDCYFPDCV